jgi:hypothetical protein
VLNFKYTYEWKRNFGLNTQFNHLLAVEVNNGQYSSSLRLEGSWSAFVEKWWQTLSVTFISGIIACYSVVWTLKMAAKVAENEVLLLVFIIEVYCW